MKVKYSQDFKNEAVALALSSDFPYAQIAKNLGVDYQTFGNWMRKAMSEEKTSITKPNKKDYQSLEKELCFMG
jgi:transposase-like protein